MKKKKTIQKKGTAQRKNALLRKNSVRYRQQRRKNIFMILAGILILIALAGCVVGIRKAVSTFNEKRARIQLEKQKEQEDQRTIRIGLTGSMMLHDALLDSKWYSSDREHFDFSEIFKYITPYYSAVDFMTCEFEGALTGGDYSGYPSFSSPDEIVQTLADSGVDLQLLATNHIYDEGSNGLHRTMDVYDQKNLDYTGIRQNTEIKNYKIVDLKGAKIGFINYVYETQGGNVRLNDAPVSGADEDLINTFDYEELNDFYTELGKSLEEMKRDGAQFLIVNMHWGTEYQLTESEVQDEIAKKLCSMGVDAVIGGHPHCEQPIDLLESEEGHKMFCIYSVGNALSNQRKELISQMREGHTEDGVMVTLVLYKDQEDQIILKNVELLPTWVSCQETSKGRQYYILPLDQVENLERNTGLSGIQKDAQASYDRTMSVLGAGLQKARAALQQ